jgi:hypothetical protein
VAQGRADTKITSGEREQIRVKATRCHEHQMDFCLELTGSSRGAKKYYSRKGWEIDGKSSMHDLEHRIDHVMRAAATTPPSRSP